jgi:hypothetical protein
MSKLSNIELLYLILTEENLSNKMMSSVEEAVYQKASRSLGCLELLRFKGGCPEI